MDHLGDVTIQDLRQETGVGALRDRNFFVKHREDSHVPNFQHVQARLVVFERRVRNDHTLSFVLVLLQLEDVLVKVGLQLLVAVVDAQLLEGVQLERLEPENVQHVDLTLGPRRIVTQRQGGVDLDDQPVEKVGIHLLHHGVPRILRLSGCE